MHMMARCASGTYEVENSSTALSRYPTKVTYLFPVMAVIRPEYHPAWVMVAEPTYLFRLKAEAATRLLAQPAWAEKERFLV